MQLIDNNGNVFSIDNIEIIGPDGKPKTLGGGGGSPTGPAGGDLSGSYPNPGVTWANGLPVYNLSYYPLASNPAGYLTAITSLDITTALGYTPYNSTNPAGYITGITGLDVTTALGYTPVNKAGDSMLGFLTLNSDPTSALHAATKQYVDNLSAGINFHSPCHVATTGNLSATYSNGTGGVGATLTSTVNAALVIDSHSLSVGERVLVWQQSAGLQNGIYDVTDAGSVSTPWILTRSSDADNSPSGELQNGDFTFIQQGATYGGFGFILNTTGTITVGVTAINYVQFNTAQAVTAGYGLQELTPNVFSVDTSLIATIASLGSYLTSAAAAATYYPLTNPSGYITGITSLDVTTALGYTPYNATNPAGYTSNTGTVTSVAALTLGTTGTDLSSTVATGTTTPVITLNVPTASATNRGALSAADWTNFNSKARINYNNSSGAQSISANTVTYLTGSSITTENIQAGTVVTWNVSVTKTAAGTAAPVFTVRFGTNASTADATLLTFTGAAQTAAADTGEIIIRCTFRSVGSGTSAVLVGHYSLIHQLDSTGLSTGGGGSYQISAGFNSTTANAFLGLTVNTGASAAWTVNIVNTKIEDLL